MAKITVLKIDITKAPKGYNVAEVAYKTIEGQTKGMKVLDFVQKEVFATLKDCQAGDVLEASFEKNQKGYWQFAHVEKTGERGDASTPAQKADPKAPAKGNWETTEERAARQVLIVRQSCLSTAVDFLGGKKVTEEDVIKTAQKFEAYVFSKEPAPVGEVE